MIVKDEARVIGRLVASVRPLISAWVISDTGSSDGTPATVKDLLGHLPGELRQDEWHDYASNRSTLLEACRASELADYWLLIDADETVVADLPLPELDADAYHLKMDYPPLRYWVPRLVASRTPWSYRGYAHEYLYAAVPTVTARLGNIRLTHHADGGNHTGKLDRELELLTRDDADNPGNPRTVFYIARTLDDMRRWADAIGWYERRKRMNGWDEEVWYSWFRIGVCNLALSYSYPECRQRGIEELLDAYQVRPWRAEPIRFLANFYERERSGHLAYITNRWADGIDFPAMDSLFIDTSAYRR